MKYLEDIRFETREPVLQPVVDNASFIKRNLMKSVNRTGDVYRAIESWLYSWEGAISRDAFDKQMRRLDFDDKVAAEQLSRAKGRRTIPLPPPPKMPKLQTTLVEAMISDKYVAVFGRKFKPAIRELIQQLRECGTVSVLSIEELIVQYKSYNDKGAAPQMMEDAIKADFLVIVDLELPIHLEWHIREAIERIGRQRESLSKPIVSTWCRFNDCNEFFKRFKIYDI